MQQARIKPVVIEVEAAEVGRQTVPEHRSLPG
jgi:hypothetical protein